MSALTSRAFWAATAERAVKTAAQVATATIGTTAMFHQVDWPIVGSTTGLATLLSVLMSIGSSNFGNVGPSLTSEVLTPPAPEIPADEDATG